MLIFLRHGRTAYNAEGRLQGQRDAPLDEVGWRQAAEVGAHLREHYDIGHVITSALTRARQTAEVAGFADLPTTVDQRWREIDFGNHDTRKMSELGVNLGAMWLDDIEWIPTGGAESMGMLHRRVGAALGDAVATHNALPKGHAVLVVSHSIPIKSAVTHVVKATPEMIMRLNVGLASISTASRNGDDLVLVSFNERPYSAGLR